MQLCTNCKSSRLKREIEHKDLEIAKLRQEQGARRSPPDLDQDQVDVYKGLRYHPLPVASG